MHRRLILLSILVITQSVATLWAQPVPSRDPASTHVFPAGGRRGTVVPVRIGGECMPPEMKLCIWGEGVTAPRVLGAEIHGRYEASPRRSPTEIPNTYPREFESRFEIDPGAPLGPVMWRLTSAQGGTGARPFIVGELPEHIETESNSQRDRAESIALPVTVNGQIAGERDLDYYRFRASAGDVVVFDVMAGRLGSPLDPAVEILDRDGHPLEVEEVRIGSDPVLAFRAPRAGEYLLLVSNLTVHGSAKYVYRINISTSPYVLHAFPPGGQAGQTVAVRFHVLSGHGETRIIERPVAIPPDAKKVLWYRDAREFMNSIPLAAGDEPELVEADDNDAASTAMRIVPAVTVNGRFLEADDEDWFRFTAEKDAAYTIECRPFPPGRATLPILTLYDQQGTRLREVWSVDSAERDCRIEWRAPAGGDYLLQARDLQHGIRGGPDFIYRLTVRPAAADFDLTLSSDFVHVVQGASTSFEVTAKRMGGFEDAIDLSLGDLPDGVHVTPGQIPAKEKTVKVTVQADKDARPMDTALRVVGRANVNDRVLQRVAAAPHWGLDPDGVSVESPVIDNLHLTIRHKPVFRLYCSEAYLYAHRGTVFPYPMELERLDGYDGEIVLQIGDRQNRDLDGIEMIQITVPPPETEIRMPIYLPETMHINVQSQSQLYVQGYTEFRDRWGEKQSFLVVSEKRCMIRTMPPVVKLKEATGGMTARPGETIECRLELERTSNFTGLMDVELISPGPGSGFTAKPARFEAGATSAMVPVSLGEIEAGGVVTLEFRAVGRLESGATVISETSLPVRLDRT